MLQRLAGRFAASGVLFALIGLLPAFRGQRLNVVFFVPGIVFLVLAITLGSALGRKRTP